MPAKVESTPALPGPSLVCGKPIIARFDGGKLSSDGGVLALGEIETRLGIANRLAACVAEALPPQCQTPQYTPSNQLLRRHDHPRDHN